MLLARETGGETPPELAGEDAHATPAAGSPPLTPCPDQAGGYVRAMVPGSRIGVSFLLLLATGGCGDQNVKRILPMGTNMAAPAQTKHTNRLAKEKSPYLLQHAHNPVDWFAWGEEAFEKARREN